MNDTPTTLARKLAQLAKWLGVGQDTVSRYERRTDMLLSTLQGYVRAMGGELDLVASFPGRPPMKIRSLGDVSASRAASPSPWRHFAPAHGSSPPNG